jgi:hypothetical protein
MNPRFSGCLLLYLIVTSLKQLMETIQWSNYNGEQFQIFCNALLSFEMGKAYLPFSAPGRDGGIDGLFSGSYGEQSGNWRFQYKFSKQSRADAAAMIKSGLAGEVEKLADEDIFVLVTNVELSPREQQGLRDLFEGKIKKNDKTTVAFELWDGAKLFALYLKYPILGLWLEDGFQTAQLQDYRVFFKERLENEGLDPGAFNNYFIARESDIAELTVFLEGQSPMVLISGDAGIGKTRLVIEFFKRVVDQLEEWEPLVLSNYRANFDRLRKALLSEKKFVVLVDDAHQYAPADIADLRMLAQIDGRVKLILTARHLEASGPLTLLSPYDRERVVKMQLSELSRADTKALFEQHLVNSNHYFYSYIGQLIEISFCKPILIVALLAAIDRQTPIYKIKEQDFLKQYVNGHFENYYAEVYRLTAIPIAAVKRLLQNIVLIEPVNLEDPALTGKLAEIHGLQQKSIEDALKLLKSKGLATGRFEQSIKPDFYSDILLSDIDRKDAEHYSNELIPYLHQVVINLSSVDEIIKREHSLLDEILTAYTNVITVTGEMKVVTRILDTMVTIALVQPTVARKALDHYLNQLALPESLIAKDYKENRKYNYLPASSSFNKAHQILFNLLYLPAQFSFVCSRFFRLYQLSGDEKLAGNVFQFAKRDVTDYFGVTRQQFFVNYVEKNWDKLTEQERGFAIDNLKNLMILDFHGSENDSVNFNQILISTYMVPMNEPVQFLRKQIIGFLRKVYENDVSDLAKKALDLLLDIPRGIFSTTRNSRPYPGDDEIGLVLDFIAEKVANFGLKEQKDVLDKLYWYKRWKINSNFLPQIEQINEQLKPKTLAERITHLFSKTETGILDFNNVEQYISERSREIIDANPPEAIASAVIEMLSQEKQTPHFYYSFQRAIEYQFPEYGQKLYEELRRSGLESYYYLGPSLLFSLYYEHNRLDYYWSKVAELELDIAAKSDSALLRIYSRIVQGSREFNERDKAVIYQVYKKKNPENNHELAGALQCLIAAADPDIAAICKEFLSRCHQREAEMFFIWLSDNKKAAAELLEDVVLNGTIHFNLAYEIERCLNKVLRNSGADIIFAYFLKRFELKIKMIEQKDNFSNYDFMPDGEHSHLFDECPPAVKEALFERSITWFFTLPEDFFYLFFAKELLTYLQPAQTISEPVAFIFEKHIQPELDAGTAARLLEVLSVFHHKNDLLIDLVVAIYQYTIEQRDLAEETIKLVRTGCYQALTTIGVRMGVAGQPYEQDLELERTLSNRLQTVPEYDPEYELLNNVLDYFRRITKRFNDDE